MINLRNIRLDKTQAKGGSNLLQKIKYAFIELF